MSLPTPEDYGATGNGSSDDTEALQRALSELAPGGTLVLPQGRTYLHSDVLVLGARGATVRGGGTLLATDEERSALRLEADDLALEDIILGVRRTSRRWDAPDQHRVYAAPGTGLSVRRVTVTGSAASGIFLAGRARFLLEDVTVKDTRADGIHLTAGSRAGTVLRPRTSGTGDDGVAVVSYGRDGAPCNSIRVERPRVDGTRGGRGLSVVGGEDISWLDVDVRRTAAAGIYIACEGAPYDTADTKGVSVRGGRVVGANTDAGIDHGSILVFAGRDGGTVTQVDISAIAVVESRTSASSQVNVVDTGGDSADIRISDLVLETASPTPFRTTSPSCCTITGWTIAGSPAEVNP